MRITRIEPQKRNPSRRNIYADDLFVVGVGMETLLRFGLRVGDEITLPLIAEIERAEELVSARGAALRLLGVRPRTEREIRDRLREKEFGDEEIAKTIADLKSAGLLDDVQFAHMYIRDGVAKGSGKILLKRKLLLLGVDKTTVEQALQEEFAAVNMEEAATAAVTQFLKRSRKLPGGSDPRKLRNRAASFLARKGYSWDVIDPVLKNVFASDADGGPDA